MSFSFSVMEALYARGFRSAADITALSQDDFQLALTGTVAYDSAAALWGQAQNMAPNVPAGSPPGTTFQPVNPDGSLVDCVPPPCLSPTGPIAYLQEMLTLSELSRCDDPARTSLTLDLAAPAQEGTTVLAFGATAGVLPGLSAAASQIPQGSTVSAVSAATATVTLSQPLSADAPAGTGVTFAAPTLGTVLSQRRGPVGTLTASPANLETPLPLIDLVNECLEYLGAAATPAGGTVYDTTVSDGTGQAPDVLPGHSTPATPGDANAAVEPAVFNKLKADFSALPAAVLPGARRLADLPRAAGQQPVRGDADLPPVHHRVRARSRAASQPGSSRGCGATRCAPISPSSTSASRRRSTRGCSRATSRSRCRAAASGCRRSWPRPA